MNYSNKSTDNTPALVMIMAPSGSGKTTIVEHLCARYGTMLNLRRIVTYTTRSPRAGEVEGKDYWFVDRAEFERLEQQHFFCETAHFAGAWYGTPAEIIRQPAPGVIYLIVLERQGAARIKELVPSAIVIYLDLDPATRRSRLIGRRSETPEQLALRLARAEEEVAEEKQAPLADIVVQNTTIDQTVHEIMHHIMRIYHTPEKSSL